MWQNIWASFCYTVTIWNSSQSLWIKFFLSILSSCFLSRCMCCNSRNSTSDGAKVLTGAACHAILCAHACEVCTGYIHRLSDCVGVIGEPLPRLSLWCWCWIAHHWRTEGDILLITSTLSVLLPSGVKDADDLDADREGSRARATAQIEQCLSQHW